MTLSQRMYNKYSPMLTPYFSEPDMRDILLRVANCFTREDRIIWALRYFKTQGILTRKTNGIPLTKRETRFLSAHHHWIGKKFNILDFQQFSHFLSQPIALIQSIVFRNENMDELKKRLEQAENIFLKKIGDQFRDLKEEGTPICKVSEDLVWFDLGKKSSPELGRSMHDCGNSYGKYSDTIYSLRERIKTDNGEVKWRPHLTFIYNKQTKVLGERKGRFNQKPSSDWHHAIIKLLIERIEIKGLENSTQYYEKENDFTYFDLTQSDLTTLTYGRPDLLELVAEPANENYDTTIASWRKFANRYDPSGITSCIVNAYREKRIRLDSAPSRDLLKFALAFYKETLDNIKIPIPEKADSWSKIFIESFAQLPQINACDAFNEVYKGAENGICSDNTLYYLSSYYPDTISRACSEALQKAA